MTSFTNLLLDEDGDGLLAVFDISSARGIFERGYAPVGPAITADSRQTRLSVKELDAGLDPFARLGGMGDDEEDAGLVELEGVFGVEGEGGGTEAVEGLLGVYVVGGCLC